MSQRSSNPGGVPGSGDLPKREDFHATREETNDCEWLEGVAWDDASGSCSPGRDHPADMVQDRGGTYADAEPVDPKGDG